jgi:hypothetical protein
MHHRFDAAFRSEVCSRIGPIQNQRIKSNDVLFREAIVSTSEADAYERLKKERAKAAEVHSDVEEIQFTDETIQNPISKRRMPFLDAVAQVIDDNRAYWPLTARQIHYRLLNDPPLKDSSKDGRMTRRGVPSQDSKYVNDKQCANPITQGCATRGTDFMECN